MIEKLPILYSFRRCPYAIRARMTLVYSRMQCEIREIVLRDKPQSMLDISPKGTVPVLFLSDKKIFEESLDIITWALNDNDPDDWLCQSQKNKQVQIEKLIKKNDEEFKIYLDRYKYPNRYDTTKSAEYYREQAEEFVQQLEDKLKKNRYLFGDKLSLADIAIFPFIRQFINVDKQWFHSSVYQAVLCWKNKLEESELFIQAMKKYPVWQRNLEKQFLLD